MANPARNFAALAWGFWPIILTYAAVALIVVFGVLRHPAQSVPQPAPRQSEQPSDTVPNHISCQFRGEALCQPTRFNV